MAMLPQVMYSHAKRMEEQIQALQLQVEAGKEGSPAKPFSTAIRTDFSSQAMDGNRDENCASKVRSHPLPSCEELTAFWAKELKTFTGKDAAK